tara:strand:+ start:11137 stop:12606 length:1470 start_codon:yes stop_codon:yes gene_type:complete
MTLSAAEQYLLELINRGRLDPLVEAKRYGISLNADLAPGTISGDASQVLAPNAELSAAAAAHSAWMLEQNVFTHTGSGGSSAGERMAASGYDFIGQWTWRENLAWVGTTGTIDLEAVIEGQYDGLFRSAGHRANTFATTISEVGLAQVAGVFVQDGQSYNSSMLTENFAASGDATFITGVSYRDSDRDLFYSISEGRADYRIIVDGQRAVTGDSGGYGLDVGASSQTYVRINQGNRAIAGLEVDMSGGNVKLDVVTSSNGSTSLELSGSAQLLGGVADARLLGVADLSLNGSGYDNRLIGNKGDNAIKGYGGEDRLYGYNGSDDIRGGRGDDVVFGGWGDDIMRGDIGNDKLFGGNNVDRLFGGGNNDQLYGQNGGDRLYGGFGNDLLFGGNGRDVLHGGAANDRMTGGFGADVFIFTDGYDVIRDFEDDLDTIKIGRTVAGDGATISSLLGGATVRNGNTTLHFDDGDRLTFYFIDNPELLANDLLIV